MPVARIITAAREELEDLGAELRQAGYTVEFAAPGDTGAGAELVITAEVVSSEDAMGFAARAAAEMDAGVVIAPGAVQGDRELEERRRAEQLAEQQRLAAEARAQEERAERERQGREQELAEQQRLAAEAREREERQRQQQERLAAEAREREQRARQERERRLRERELAEQQRLAAETKAREERERQEHERQAALAAERERPAWPRETRPSPKPPTADAEPAFAAVRIADVEHPSLAPRRLHSSRQRRLRRATFMASLGALLIMLGFAAALSFRPATPLPQNMVQNPVRQEVPFGPAHINPPAPSLTPKPAAPAAVKPSPVPARAPRRKLPRRSAVADDEVIIHHYEPPARQTTAQTRTKDGVKIFSDQ